MTLFTNDTDVLEYAGDNFGARTKVGLIGCLVYSGLDGRKDNTGLFTIELYRQSSYFQYSSTSELPASTSSKASQRQTEP